MGQKVVDDKIDRYLSGFVNKISDGHPYHLYIGRAPELGTLRFHNVNQDDNVHVQYPVIISKKIVQLSINHKLKAP